MHALVYYAEQTDGEDENEEHILPDMLSLVEFDWKCFTSRTAV